MGSARSILRPIGRRLRSANAWVRDVASQGIDGARAYWSDPTRPDWKVNSHWRDVPAPGWSETWLEIGAEHVKMYERFARCCALTPPRRILEWSVGGGANAVHFASLSREFIAVDVAQASLDETVRQVHNECTTPVEPVLVQLEEPGRAVAHLADSVDLFICFYVLELVPNAAQALEIVRIALRTLRAGGAAIIQIKYRNNARRGHLWSTYASKLANSYVVGVPEFWELLTSVGFNVHYVELVPRNRLDMNYGYFFATRPR